MNWMVLACAAILLIFVIWGWLRGFVKMAFHFLAVGLALVMAAMLCQPLAKVVTAQDSVMDSVKKHTRETLHLEKWEGVTQIDNAKIDELELPEIVKKTLREYNTETGFKMVNAKDVADYIEGVVANIVVRAACFIGLFIVLLAIIYLIGFALNLVAKLPLLSTMNKLVGAIIGLFIGAVVILMFFTTIMAFSNSGFGQACLTEIEKNKVLSTVFNHNILSDIYFDLAGKL